MTKVTWNDVGYRYFEAGVDRGVLYLDKEPGVAWNGLTSITESPSAAEPYECYLDGVKYFTIFSDETFSGSIGAFTYPDEFSECDGTSVRRNGLGFGQQRKKPFGLSYRTRVGNDVDGSDFGYKIHILYNLVAKPSPRTYNTLGDREEPVDFTWDFTSTPVTIPEGRPSSHITIDATLMHPEVLAQIEDILYGTSELEPRLPSPVELNDLANSMAALVVKDNADGSFTASGAPKAVREADGSIFQLSWHTVKPISEDTFTITTL